MKDKPEEEPKKVSIVLTPESHQCLVEESPEHTSIFEAATHLQGYALNPDEFVVSCDLAAAEALLVIARRACKGVVKSIEIGIAAYERGQ